MPLGWERINVKHTSPNKNIVFIKPRPGPDQETSKDFLERLAAQCLPIMNKHHLAVVSLEEYEPNTEFWGRNFNNGEVIQLVLKSPTTRRWLPFHFVQLVLMHELAHNKHMNHSKQFWVVRNEFSSEMKALWEKGYTGDGLWGRGVLLENGAFSHEELGADDSLPEHMCGGTFSSRSRRKRKVKPRITYKEQQERRIKRRFGTGGVALGMKAELEKGKGPRGKPRVAGSARGRELRAAAALSRIEPKEEPQLKEDDLVTDSESELDDNVNLKNESDAIDINGSPLLDPKGQGMVRVCESEDMYDEDTERELSDLQTLGRATLHSPSEPSNTTKARRSKPAFDTRQEPPNKYIPASILSSDANACAVCSVENDPEALTCLVCSHVLRPTFVPGSWICRNSTCRENGYINSGDSGICGLCGKQPI